MKAAAAVLAAALFVVGCGYRLVASGAAHGRPLRVGPVVDDSREPLFGSQLRAALARGVVDRPEAALGASGQAGAWLLSTRVVSVQETAVAYAVGDLPRLYLLAAEIEAKLEAPGGRVVWKGLKIRSDREFAAGDKVEQTQVRKGEALTQLARQLAGEVLRRVDLVTDGGA
ncbi:MAG: hypothetical protein HZB55_17700 [Deltaproteobacteria bacterium]|nr:hypothetical protein [Deltaproteobacteria bacterium]